MYLIYLFHLHGCMEYSGMDHDRDGKLSLDEFISQFHMIDHNSIVEHSADDDTSCAEAEKKFRELDSNNDG
jgi:Ca2+-binding EF-hand superfamily protein